MKIKINDSQSQRTYDANGFMRIENCKISKASVNPYLGKEIEGFEKLGLEPEKTYMVYRPGAELEKAAKSFSMVPLLLDHHDFLADNPAKEMQIGSLGDSVKYSEPYLMAPIIVTDAKAIELIEKEICQELSCSYLFEPILESGEYNGQSYQIIMKNIIGEHVALVEAGRAGPDVKVSDKTSYNQKTKDKKMDEKLLEKAKEIGFDMEKDENKRLLEEVSKLLAERSDDSKAKDAENVDDENKACDANESGQQNKEEGAKNPVNITVAEKTDDMQKADDMQKVDNMEHPKKATDSQKFSVMDAASITSLEKRAQDAAFTKMDELIKAQNDVRPYVGDVNISMAKDSASTIYGAALQALGVDITNSTPSSYKDMFFVAKDMQKQESKAYDSLQGLDDKSPLNNIEVL